MRTKITNFLVIISMLSSNFAHANSSPVVATLATSPRQLRSYLKAHPNRMSFSTWWIKTLDNQTDREQLENKFFQAKAAYFQPSLGSPSELFGEVVALRNLTAWSPEQHKLLFHASLRVYELTEGKAKSEALKAAARLGFGLNPNDKVFSPPTLERLTEEKKKAKLVTVPVTGWMRGFDRVIYNGQVVELAERNSIQLLEGDFLFLFVSSRYQPVEIKLATEELISYVADVQPLVKTNCQLSEFAENHTPSATIVDQVRLCGQSPALKVSGSKNTPQKTKGLDLRPRVTEIGNQLDSTSVIKMKKKKAWWKNKWLWIGLAAATTAYIVYDQNQRENSSNRRDRGGSGSPAPSVSFEE